MSGYKLIVPLNKVPDGERIIKITGSVPYTVRSFIEVYQINHEKTKIEAQGDARFLVAENGNVNAYSGSKEVIWLISEESLYELLECPK